MITVILLDVLRERKMTQKKLADMTGIHPTKISEFCRGNRQRISVSHLTRIMIALEIDDINEIIRFEKN